MAEDKIATVSSREEELTKLLDEVKTILSDMGFHCSSESTCKEETPKADIIVTIQDRQKLDIEATRDILDRIIRIRNGLR